MADQRKVRFLDINGKLADSQGRLFEGMMKADRLHPAVPGYQVWADALKPIFMELLGAPGAEDKAPPATGALNFHKAGERPPGLDLQAQPVAGQGGGLEAGFSEGLKEDFRHALHGVEADEIAEVEGAHGVPAAQLHARIEILHRG